MQFNSSKQNKKAYSTEVKAVYQAVSFCQRLEFDWTRLGFFYQSMIFPTRLSWNPQPSWTLQNCPGPTQAILCPFRVSLGPDDPLQIVMVSKVSDSTKNVKPWKNSKTPEMSVIYRNISISWNICHFQPYRCVHIVFGSRFPQHILLLLCIDRSFSQK